MAEILYKTIVNCSTGEQITEEMTAEEVAEYKATQAEILARKEQEKLEAEAAEQTRLSAIAKLTALGLTEEEAKAII